MFFADQAASLPLSLGSVSATRAQDDAGGSESELPQPSWDNAQYVDFLGEEVIEVPFEEIGFRIGGVDAGPDPGEDEPFQGNSSDDGIGDNASGGNTPGSDTPGVEAINTALRLAAGLNEVGEIFYMLLYITPAGEWLSVKGLTIETLSLADMNDHYTGTIRSYTTTGEFIAGVVCVDGLVTGNIQPSYGCERCGQGDSVGEDDEGEVDDAGDSGEGDSGNAGGSGGGLSPDFRPKPGPDEISVTPTGVGDVECRSVVTEWGYWWHFYSYDKGVYTYLYSRQTRSWTTWEVVCTPMRKAETELNFAIVGNHGGGGDNPSQDDGFSFFPPEPKDPCENLAMKSGHPQFIDNQSGFKHSAANDNFEKAATFEYKDGSYEFTTKNGQPGTSASSITLTRPIDGLVHTHYPGAGHTFSGLDIYDMCKIYKHGYVKDISTFKFGVVTPDGNTYWLTISSPTKFHDYANTVCGFGDDNAKVWFHSKEYGTGLVEAENAAEAERSFLEILDTEDTGLTLMKEDSNSNRATLERNARGNVKEVGC